MAGKNKGGREVRKPKQEKKPKGTTTTMAEPLRVAAKPPRQSR